MFSTFEEKTTSNTHKCQLSWSLFMKLLTVPFLLHDSCFRGISAFIYSYLGTKNEVWRDTDTEGQIAKLYLPKSLEIHLNLVVKADNNIGFCY